MRKFRLQNVQASPLILGAPRLILCIRLRRPAHFSLQNLRISQRKIIMQEVLCCSFCVLCTTLGIFRLAPFPYSENRTLRIGILLYHFVLLV